jgi:Domain of unknown function (DUF4082)/Bacterial Ig-like domain/Bacterial Ig domain
VNIIAVLGRRRLTSALAAVVAVSPLLVLSPAEAQADPCDPVIGSEVACENSKPGTPRDEWFGANEWGDLDAYTTRFSIQAGESLVFKVRSPASYRVNIYRLGWYQGNGARLVGSIATRPPQQQPTCLTDSSTGLVDCGNWAASASWTVPTDAVSGLYVANVDRTDGNGFMPVLFVVRDNDSTSDIVVQTSDTTWQAYNKWGGQNLYDGGGPAPDGRAYKVSYNRPLSFAGMNSYYRAEYGMISWLERNGYDVSYISGLDATRNGDLLRNHRAYISSGHDEYWSDEQRINVEAARAAGVNLAFFSGNEVFWKTRWEPSIDGTNTPDRTLVSYKETKLAFNPPNGIADPSDVWTGTWRDPAGTSQGGGRPENALTGTLFMVNGPRYDPMRVPAEYGRLRFWRNTSVATLTAGQTATFQAGILGYEWDEDPANASRPSGGINLSETTIDIDDGNYLLDQGNTYGNGQATHKLVLYRDPVSGALVFGAGTVQWAWGLDEHHPEPTTTQDVRIQQATVNLLADMHADPVTLQSNLVGANASVDTVAPLVTVSEPANGATVPALKAVNITGTSSDVGGTVARVELSFDGGTTWSAAAGTTSWTYAWTPKTLGPVTILVRAIDDSVNVGSSTSNNVTVGPQECPCTVFPASTHPSTPDAGDGNAIETGVKFRTTTNGAITGIRFYKSAANTGTHTGSLWTASGTLLARGTFSSETASGWQQLNLSSAVPAKANTTYVASYYAPNGRYAADGGYFADKGAGLPPVEALKSGVDGANGVYRYGSSGFPTTSYNDTNYYVDVVFDTNGGDTTPPTVTIKSPDDGANMPITATPIASFSESIDKETLGFALTDPNGQAVSAGVKYDVEQAKATLQPNTYLAADVTYTARVEASDLWGNAMTPVTWSFTTHDVPLADLCPCTVFGPNDVPETASANDSSSLEIGMRFQSSADGYVTGVRFYKGAGNTGPHKGSLWASDGRLLAQVTFTSETGSGWQHATFGTPVRVAKDTTYVVSYYAPNGRYSVDSAYFPDTSHNRYPLSGLRDGIAGANGLYRYGTGGFPTQSYNASNYWVDVVFTPEQTDTVPPTVTATAPAAGAPDVRTDTKVSATFSEDIDDSTLTVDLTAPDGSAVASVLNYDAATQTATLTPQSRLATATTYAVAARASDTAGNAMTEPTGWSFTTAAQHPDVTCPCSIWDDSAQPQTATVSDPNAIEVGVRFRSDVDGYITGIRFYKGAGNTGSHTGSLWTNAGQPLGIGTFTNETSTGWQTLTFGAPVPITAGQTYVASYHAPNGGYSATPAYFATQSIVKSPLSALRNGLDGSNGVYRYGATAFPTGSYQSTNYWVDVVFTTTP